MKKKVIFITLILVPLSIVVYLYTRQNIQKTSLPEENIISTNYSGVGQGKIVFTGKEPDIPDTFNVYTNDSLSGFKHANKLAADLSLGQSPVSNKLWANSDNTKTLTYTTLTHQIQYTHSPQTNSGSFNKALVIARKFISDLGENNVNATPINTAYYAGLELKETNQNQAEFVEYVFLQEIDTFPIYVESSVQPQITLLLNRASIIVKAVFPDTIFTQTNTKALNAYSFNKVLESLISGKAQIINSQNLLGYVVNLEDLESVNYNNTEIQYRLSKSSNLVIPYFSFSGFGIIKSSGETVEITAIIPAVDTNQL